MEDRVQYTKQSFAFKTSARLGRPRAPHRRARRAIVGQTTTPKEPPCPSSVFDQDALIEQFAQASARQGEALRKAVQEATLKALQGRELTLKNIKDVVKQVSGAVAQGAGQNPMGAAQMEPLLAKAVAGMDAALLQAVEANRRALQQLMEYGAGLRENQVKKAMSDIENMEDMFFTTVRKAVADGAGPLQGAWTQVLDKMQMKGSGTGAHATQTIEQLTEQAQTALREGRAMGMKAAQTLLDSYAALASGVLIGMSQGMQGDAGEASAKATKQPNPKAPAAARLTAPGGRTSGARTPCSCRTSTKISQVARKIAAITGPMTKPFRPNAARPPSVAISTR